MRSAHFCFFLMVQVGVRVLDAFSVYKLVDLQPLPKQPTKNILKTLKDQRRNYHSKSYFRKQFEEMALNEDTNGQSSQSLQPKLNDYLRAYWGLMCRKLLTPVGRLSQRVPVGNGLRTADGGNLKGISAKISTHRLILACFNQAMKFNRRKTLITIGTCILGTASALLIPLGFGNLVGVLSSCTSGKILNQQGILKALLFLGGTYLAEAVSTYYFVSRATDVIDDWLSNLKKQAFQNLVAQEISFFDMNSPSEITAMISRDMFEIKKAMTGNLQRDRGLRAILEVVFGFIILFALSPQLAAVFFFVVPLTAFLVRNSWQAMLQQEYEETISLRKEAGITGEVMSHMREVNSFGTHARECERFREQVDFTASLTTNTGRNRAVHEAFSRSAIYISTLLVAWRGGTLLAKGAISVPLLVSFIRYCFTLNFAIMGVSLTVGEWQHAIDCLKPVYSMVINNPNNAASKWGVETIPPSEFAGKIEFRKVYFSYPSRPNKVVLDNVQLTLQPGTVTALVGSSGAGKSTIAGLLSKHYFPSQGTIYLDGVPMLELDRKWLTQQISLVGQTSALFSGTLSSNIAYGVTGAVTQEQIEQAAKLANAHDFIMEFPEGYNTTVGQKGVFLSTGQKQRITIARAILKNPKILVLDEATSALDTQSESLVQEALERLMVGRTVLVIAHRLSTVFRADNICVIHEGKIVETGNHTELISKEKGYYKKLMTNEVTSYTYSYIPEPEPEALVAQ